MSSHMQQAKRDYPTYAGTFLKLLKRDSNSQIRVFLYAKRSPLNRSNTWTRAEEVSA